MRCDLKIDFNGKMKNNMEYCNMEKQEKKS